MFCLMVELTLAVNPSAGQEKVGSFNGVVVDETGAVLPGVAITITNIETARGVTVMTGGNGAYFARNLDPGRYSLRFDLPGFLPTVYPDIPLNVGKTLRLDPRMRVSGIETAVEVTDTVPMMDIQSPLRSHNVTSEKIEQLPSSRTFQYFAITAPSVNAGEIEGGVQVNGASGSENAFYIDGLAVNSIIEGRSRQNAPPEFVQQVQIKTGGTEAEYGGALGGVITAVTKSGGNEFHGEGHFYFSGSALAASPVRRLVIDPRDDRSVSYVQDETDPERHLEPGFSLGGPIRRNMLYFFTSWSPRYRNQDRKYLFGNGAEQDLFERNQTYMSGFNKISFDPTPRIRSNFTMLWTPTKSQGTLQAFNGAGPNWDSRSAASVATNKTRGYFAPQTSYTGNIDFILGSNMLLSTRGGFFWDNYLDTGIPNITSVEFRTPSIGVPGVPVNLQQGVGYTNTPRSSQNRHDRTSTTFGQADLSFSGRLAGVHNLKTGYGLRKSVNSVDISNPGGVYIFLFWDRTFTGSPTGVQDRGQYGYYQVNEVGTIGSAGAGIKSLYVQDQWQVHPQLTLSLGIRAEQERIPSFRRDIRDYAFDFGWGDKIAPRLGASFDLRGDGSIKLFGSWSRLYDWTKYTLARATFGGQVARVRYRSLDTLDVFSFNRNNLPGRDLWIPSIPDSVRDVVSPSFGPEQVDPNIKPMSQNQLSFGVDYQWNTETVFGAHYIHQNLRRTIEDVGVLVDGSIHWVFGNPGEGSVSTVGVPSGLTANPIPYPKPVRTYDALELTFARRMSNGWFGDASYTWSRLYGNYPGIASSDEILTPSAGVVNPGAQQQGGNISRWGNNANEAWDIDEILFDSKGNFDPKGRLPTDRPHVFKLNGGYEWNWNSVNTTQIGGFFYAGSGTPLSTKVNTTNHYPVFVNGRGDMGRTAMLSYTDLQVSHTLSMGESQRLRFEFNILNAFNQKTSRHRFDWLNRGYGVDVDSSVMNLRQVDLRSGYDYAALLRATPDGANAFDPRFGMDDLFNTGFAGRFGVKWMF
jgi:hypothetical protein